MNRWLRYALVGLAAFGLAKGIEYFTRSTHTIQIIYEAPAGELHVTLRDAEARVVRRTWFGAPPRQHEIDLPPGEYSVQLDVGEGDAVTRALVVSDDAVVTVRWW